MQSLKGCLLVPTPKNADSRLWFIFHHESDGILACDLTTPHPDIPYRHFENFMPDTLREKAVLLGGPMQADTALLILHDDDKAADAHVINDAFRFTSRRFVLVPGHPPSISAADGAERALSISPAAHALVVMGFRLWSIEDLERELGEWQWYFLPASPSVVFATPSQERLQKALLSIN